MSASSKLPTLLKLLERDPRDAFTLYAIGLEHKRLGDLAAAIDFLNRTLAVDAGYCYAYYQLGQVEELREDSAAARSAYERGIEASRRVGDAKAQGELQGAIDMLT